MTNKVITISRQFGSGGRSIGKAVAEKLGIPYYDKELVDKVAKESGFSHEFIEEIGEYASVTSSFLFNIAVSSHPMGLVDTMSVSDKLYVCQTNVIRDLASKGPCVIVGRCADFILKDQPDCLHIFIHSDMTHRAARVRERYGETSKPMEKRLQEKDSKRKVYYKHYTNRNWGEAESRIGQHAFRIAVLHFRFSNCYEDISSIFIAICPSIQRFIYHIDILHVIFSFRDAITLNDIGNEVIDILIILLHYITSPPKR